VAMHLIQGKLAGKDVPSVLPPSLVPPSMRGLTNQTNGSLFTVPAPQELHKDLLWDDSPPASATTSQPTGTSGGIFAPAATSPSRPVVPQDPFGSSPFGGGATISACELIPAQPSAF
jgi:epidermal growth factor receptor substrate 15